MKAMLSGKGPFISQRNSTIHKRTCCDSWHILSLLRTLCLSCMGLGKNMLGTLMKISFKLYWEKKWNPVPRDLALFSRYMAFREMDILKWKEKSIWVKRAERQFWFHHSAVCFQAREHNSLSLLSLTPER